MWSHSPNAAVIPQHQQQRLANSPSSSSSRRTLNPPPPTSTPLIRQLGSFPNTASGSGSRLVSATIQPRTTPHSISNPISHHTYCSVSSFPFAPGSKVVWHRYGLDQADQHASTHSDAWYQAISTLKQLAAKQRIQALDTLQPLSSVLFLPALFAVQPPNHHNTDPHSLWLFSVQPSSESTPIPNPSASLSSSCPPLPHLPAHSLTQPLDPCLHPGPLPRLMHIECQALFPLRDQARAALDQLATAVGIQTGSYLLDRVYQPLNTLEDLYCNPATLCIDPAYSEAHTYFLKALSEKALDLIVCARSKSLGASAPLSSCFTSHFDPLSLDVHLEDTTLASAPYNHLSQQPSPVTPASVGKSYFRSTDAAASKPYSTSTDAAAANSQSLESTSPAKCNPSPSRLGSGLTLTTRSASHTHADDATLPQHPHLFSWDIPDLIQSSVCQPRKALRLGNGIVLLPPPVSPTAPTAMSAFTPASFASSPSSTLQPSWLGGPPAEQHLLSYPTVNDIHNSQEQDDSDNAGTLFATLSLCTNRSSVFLKMSPTRLRLEPLVGSSSSSRLLCGSLLMLAPFATHAYFESWANVDVESLHQDTPTNIATDDDIAALAELKLAINLLIEQLDRNGIDQRTVLESRWVVCVASQDPPQQYASITESERFMWLESLCFRLLDRPKRLHPSTSQHHHLSPPHHKLQSSRSMPTFAPATPLKQLASHTLTMLRGLQAAAVTPDPTMNLEPQLPSSIQFNTASPAGAMDPTFSGLTNTSPLHRDANPTANTEPPSAGRLPNDHDPPPSAAVAMDPWLDDPLQQIQRPWSPSTDPDLAFLERTLQTTATTVSTPRLAAPAPMLGSAPAPKAPVATTATTTAPTASTLTSVAPLIASSQLFSAPVVDLPWMDLDPLADVLTDNGGQVQAQSADDSTAAPSRPTGDQDMFDSFGLITEDDFSFFDQGAFDLGSSIKPITAFAGAMSFPDTNDTIMDHDSLPTMQPHVSNRPLTISPQPLSISALTPVPRHLQPQQQHQGQREPERRHSTLDPPLAVAVVSDGRVESKPIAHNSTLLHSSMNHLESGDIEMFLAPPRSQDAIMYAQPIPRSSNDRADTEPRQAMPIAQESSVIPATAALLVPTSRDASLTCGATTSCSQETPKEASSLSSFPDPSSLPAFTPGSLTSSSPAFANSHTKTPRTPYSPSDNIRDATILIEGQDSLPAGVGVPRTPHFAIYGPAAEFASHEANDALSMSNASPIDVAWAKKKGSLVPLSFLPLNQQNLPWLDRKRRLVTHPSDLSSKYDQLGKFSSAPKVDWLHDQQRDKGQTGSIDLPTPKPNPQRRKRPYLASARPPRPGSHVSDSTSILKAAKRSDEVLRRSRFKMPFFSTLGRDSPQSAWREKPTPAADPPSRDSQTRHLSESDSTSDDDGLSDAESEDERAAKRLRVVGHRTLISNAIAHAKRWLQTDCILSLCPKRKSDGVDGVEATITSLPCLGGALSEKMLGTLVSWLVENPEFRSLAKADDSTRHFQPFGSSHVACSTSDSIDLLDAFGELNLSQQSQHTQDVHSRSCTTRASRLNEFTAPTLKNLVQCDREEEDQQPSPQPSATCAAAAGDLPKPNLDEIRVLEPPRIAVGCQGNVIHVAPTALPFWDKANFAAVGGPKHVVAKVLLPHSTLGWQDEIMSWLRRVQRAFQTCGLGTHTPAEEAILTLGNSSDLGLSSYLDRLSLDSEIWLDTVRSISDRIKEQLAQDKHVVLYILQTQGSAACRESSFKGLLKLETDLRSMLRDHIGMLSDHFILRPVSLDMITESGSVGLGLQTQQLRRFIFSIYDQLLRVVRRTNAKLLYVEEDKQQAAAIRYPSFTLVPWQEYDQGQDRVDKLTLELKWPFNRKNLLDVGMFLHVGYDFLRKKDTELTMVSVMDQRAQMHAVDVWHSSGDLRRELGKVWSFTLSQAKSANVEWRIVIAKAGVMASREVGEWKHVLKHDGCQPEYDTTLCCAVQDWDMLLLPRHRQRTPAADWMPASTTTTTPSVLLDGSSITYAVLPQRQMPLFSSPTSSGLGGGSSGRLPKWEDRIDGIDHHHPILPLRSSLLITSSKQSTHTLSIHLVQLYTPPSSLAGLNPRLAAITQSLYELCLISKHRFCFPASLDLLPWHLAVLCLVDSYLD